MQENLTRVTLGQSQQLQLKMAVVMSSWIHTCCSEHRDTVLKLCFQFFCINTKKWYYWIIWKLYCYLFWETTILFSILTVIIYFPTNSISEFSFLHLFTTIYLFLFHNSHIDRCELMSYCLICISLWLLISNFIYIYIYIYIYITAGHLYVFFREMSNS
jgi:hypothetical protein